MPIVSNTTAPSITSTSSQILGQNLLRTGIVITNRSADGVYLKFGTGAATGTNYSASCPAGTVKSPGLLVLVGDISQEAVQCVSDVAGPFGITVCEFTAG